MSIIFGMRATNDEAVTEQELSCLASATQSFAPDGSVIAVAAQIGMGFQSFLTTSASRYEFQPATDAQKNMLTFDGRLDNRLGLLSELRIHDAEVSDSALILAGFGRWGEAVFAKLIGEWALALWSEGTQTLYLARDHAGTRTLYLQATRNRLRWSTYLDTFFADGDEPPLNDEYCAAFLCGAPIRNLTPYRGIRAVPPSYYVAIHKERLREVRHWNPLIHDEIRYKFDEEYERRFFTLFEQAVGRRTEVSDPVLAQLSGGMDSTSIVCMSDHIRHSQGHSGLELLDTISYLSPSEPNWNEEPFISATEARRGKVGIHLEASFSERMIDPPPFRNERQHFPGVTAAVVDFQERFHASVRGKDYRVILSGVGGDEVLGGVPTPGPILANYLTRMDLSRFFMQGLSWLTALRIPMLHLLLGTARFALELYLPRFRSRLPPPPWLAPKIRKLQEKETGTGISFASRVRAVPSALSNARTWSAILETLPNLWPAPGSRYEYRYPYLDRELVEFLFRVPREQITRPGRRRSLMRRALRELLPTEVLERRRKAFISRGPLVALQNAHSQIMELLDAPMLAEMGWIDAQAACQAADEVTSGRDVTGWPYLLRAILLELWLRHRASVPSDLRILNTQPILFEPLEQPSSVRIGGSVSLCGWISQQKRGNAQCVT